MIRSLTTTLTLALLSLTGSALANPAAPYSEELGTGYDLRSNGIDARGICLDESPIGIGLSSNSSVQIYEAKSWIDLQAQLEASAEVDILDKMTSAANVLASISLETNESFFAFAMRIETVNRYFGQRNLDDGAGYCNEGTPEGYEDFMNECGTHWLARETLGGYVIGFVRLESFEGELEIRAGARNKGSYKKVTGGTEVAASFLGKLANSEFTGEFRLEGLPLPGSLSEDTPRIADGYTITPQELMSYFAEFDVRWREAYQSGVNTRDQAYGTPIRQVLQSNLGLMASCGVDLPADVRAGLSCAEDVLQDGRTNEARLTGTAAPLSNEITTLDSVLKHPKSWVWGADPGAQRREFEAAHEHILRCRQDVIPEIFAACQEASFATTELCEVCSIPETADEMLAAGYPDALLGCTEQAIARVMRNLPDLSIFNPNIPNYSTHRKAQGSPEVSLGSIEDQVCMLTGVTGEFAGGGESVRVRVAKSNWRFRVTGMRPDLSESPSADVTCVTKRAFSQAGQSPTFLNEEELAQASTSTGVGLTNAHQYGTALAGFKGRLNDASDAAYVLAGEDRPFVDGDITEAWAQWFGAELPNGATPNTVTYSLDSNSDPSATVAMTAMEPLDTSVCYLTSISGDFDGRGEWVKVRRSGENWMFSLSATCEEDDGWFTQGTCTLRKPVSADVTCYAFDQ